MSDKQNSMLGHHGQLKSSSDQPLLDGIPAPIFYKDAEGIYRACNTAFAKLVLGLPKERIIGSSVYDIPEAIPPELADIYHERDMELIHNPGTQVYEAQVKYTDGLLHDVVFNKSTLIDAEGKVTGMAGVMLDVTERKHLEERERYTTKLRIAAEVAERISAALDIDAVLAEIVTQLQQEFDFYHVHIYLLDESQQNLVIQHGSGETGRKLLEEKHTIPLSFKRSLVARAARALEMVIVPDTSQEPDYLSHPLFPHTRSELTVPLISHNELLGILDVQDDKVDRFDRTDIDILATLAGQIATALQNARTFAREQQIEKALQQRVLALTSPDINVGDLQFQDVFDLDEIQRLQDLFATATGVASIITTSEGVPITRPSNFCRFCRYIRSTELGQINCFKSDAIIGRPNPEGPILQPCLSGGLWDAGVSIHVGDKHVANWLIGQILTDDAEVERVIAYGREMGADEDIIRESLKEVTRMPLERFEVIADTLFHFAGQLSNMALQNVQQARDITQRQKDAEEISRFALQLRTGSEIATQINTILDPDELLNTVIPLLKERFGLYYIHVYTLDDESEELVLRAGYGEPGREMLAAGHKILLAREQSLVARAARTKELVVVQDVAQEPGFLANPLLPDTKSEVAIPIVSSGEVLGVFDIQQDKLEAFTEADLDVFKALAGQIASALRNARLFDVQARAEQVARESEAESTALLNAVPDMMFRFDKEGNFLDYKAEAGAVLIAPPEAFLGKHITEVLPPELARITLSYLQQTLDTGAIVVYEYQAPVGEELRFYEARMTPVGDQEVLSLIRDITERKEAEVERQRFTLLLGTASEIATQANAILDPDELLSTVIRLLKDRFDLYYAHVYTLDDENQRLILRAGYGEPGRVMLSQGHHIPLDTEQSLVARAALTHQVALVDDVQDNLNFLSNPLLPHTKTEIAVPLIVGDHVLGVLDIQHDEPHYFTQAYIDVFNTLAGQIATALENAYLFEEQHKVRIAIQQSQQRFQDLVETLSDWIWEVDTNGAYTYVSPKVTEILGYLPDELLGKTPFDLMPSDEVQRVAPVFGKLIAAQEPIVALENTSIHKDGHLIIFETSGTPYYDADGNYLGYRGTDRDITERKQVEAQIIESEERLSLALEAANTASWEFRPLDGYVYFGPRWYTMLGYEPNELPQVIGTWSSLLHPDDFTWVDPFIQEHIQEGKDYALDFRMRTKDGNWRWIHAIGKVTERNEDGVAARIVGTHTDITEQRLAEQDRDRQAHIIQSSTDFIAIANSDGKGVYINAAGLDMIGYTEEEFTSGMSIPDVQPAMPKGAIEMAFRDGIWEGESSIVAKDGRVIPVSQTLFTMTVGTEIMLATIARDITAQKQVEAVIQENERRLSTLMGNLPGMAYRMLNQPDWPAEFISEGSLELTGYKPQELIVGKSHKLNYGDLIHPDDQDRVWEGVQAGLAKQEPYELTYRIHNTAGELRWVWERGQGVFDSDGNLLSLEGFITDVTASQQAEAERERFTTRLNTAAQISEQVGSILDPDELLQTVIPLIKEQFGLYYVHVYTLDEESGLLNLRAGYGEAGEKMLAEGHSIPLDREASLVATAARTKEPVLVDDVTENPNFMPNPLLPDTKTEVAVPSIAGGKVLGVFDVQHDEAHYFTQADLDVFQTLAAQIANAFQSAEAFNIAEQERQRAQTYLNVAGSIIVALDKAGDIILLNKAGCDVLGYEEAELLGKNWFDVSLPAEIADVVKGVFAQIIAGDIEQTEYYENEILTRSGEMRIVAWRNSLITDDRGHITGVLSSGEDITERKRAEEEIRTFQTLAEQSTDGILMADLGTQTLTYANQAAYELFGCDYESREMLGKDGALFWAEEELPRLGNVLAQAVREGWQGDVLQRRLDGSTFSANVTTFVLRDAEGNPTQLVIMTRDITERKHAEKILQESEQKLSDALRIAKMANWEFDVEAQTFLFNDQYYRTFHNTTAEEVGGYEMSAATFAQRFVVPEDAPDVAKNIQMALAATNPDFQLQTEARNLTVDGKEVWTSIWLTIEKDEAGKTTKLYGVNQDITERKQVEAERERFAARLNTAAQISEQVGSILDPDELLQTVIPLIKEQFGLYYVHVYTFDEESGLLNLRAGYGEAGEKMLAEG
ncbi:MAG: PAS domain S-box protein, partial [Anaerolineae bacterium]|nr:PAS domain S-box protein [Anaerolineae bacterium]